MKHEMLAVIWAMFSVTNLNAVVFSIIEKDYTITWIASIFFILTVTFTIQNIRKMNDSTTQP
jgi:uncharacterized membrane protein YqjE